MTRGRPALVALLLAGAALVQAGVSYAQPGVAEQRLRNAHYYENNRYWLAAAAERLWADEALRNLGARSDNQHHIWRLLQRLPSEQFGVLPAGLPVSAVGWWALARLDKLYHDDPWRYALALDQWAERYPNHPAQESVVLTLRSGLPVVRQRSPALDGLAPVPTLRAARRVALVVPLAGPHGPAGQAIRDGFVDAARQAGGGVELRVVDARLGGPLAAYNRASREFVDLIVGPLDKAAVTALSRRGGLAVPTLALNYAEQASAWAPAQLFQFGLAPEDEAATAAAHAIAMGHSRAAILSADDAWGSRVADAFARQFSALGGQIIEHRGFAPGGQQLQAAVKDFLGVDTGWRLWKDWRPGPDAAARPLHRPAQRIDLAFVAARARDARQIHPLLRFYEAVDLPVYATGAVYESEADQERDHDLRGLVFCDAVSAPTADEAVAENLPRLHRLGRDAYRLSQALPSLLLDRQQVLDGETGRLHLDAVRGIRREPACHRIAVGTLQAAG